MCCRGGIFFFLKAQDTLQEEEGLMCFLDAHLVLQEVKNTRGEEEACLLTVQVVLQEAAGEARRCWSCCRVLVLDSDPHLVVPGPAS